MSAGGQLVEERRRSDRAGVETRFMPAAVAGAGEELGQARDEANNAGSPPIQPRRDRTSNATQSAYPRHANIRTMSCIGRPSTRLYVPSVGVVPRRVTLAFRQAVGSAARRCPAAPGCGARLRTARPPIAVATNRHPNRSSSPPPAPGRSAPSMKCDGCGERFIGTQRCEDCNLFARRIGPGGPCPHREEPVAVADLVEVSP